MKLFTKAILKNLPPIGATAELESEDNEVRCKLFNAMGVGTWYIVEYDPETGEAFGFVNLGNPDFAELGYFNVNEIKNTRGVMLERDKWFTKMNLAEVIKTVKDGGHI